MASSGPTPNSPTPQALGHETRAFVLGYMCHLVTDEYWIAQVYRPYFGKKASSDPITNVLDRVLQFDMDKRERNGIRDLDAVLEALKSSDVGVNVSFIDADLLSKWKDVMTERTSMDLGWDHLRRFVRKALPRHLKDDEDTMNSVIDQGPDLLEKGQTAGSRPRHRRLPSQGHRPVRCHCRGVSVVRVITDLSEARAFLRRLHAGPDHSLNPKIAAGIKRVFGEPLSLSDAVGRILDDVRTKGDAALFDYLRRIDGLTPDRLEIPQSELYAAP